MLKRRLLIEVRWLIALGDCDQITEVPKLSEGAKSFLENLIDRFDLEAAEHIKTIERTTNHDVKAVEYYLKQQLSSNEELNRLSEFVHFACTSEDINNLAYALMLDDARSQHCLLYTSPSPRDLSTSRMPSSA